MNPQEMTSEQRLQQIEILLATAAKTINRNAEGSKRNTEAIERLSEEGLELSLKIARLSEEGLELRLTIAQLSEMFTESVGIIRQQQTNIERIEINIEKMQTEIRGLQVENQRILERFFGENNSD